MCYVPSEFLNRDAISITPDHPKLTANRGELTKRVFRSHFYSIFERSDVRYVIVSILPRFCPANHVGRRSGHICQGLVEGRDRAITKESFSCCMTGSSVKNTKGPTALKYRHKTSSSHFFVFASRAPILPAADSQSTELRYLQGNKV